MQQVISYNTQTIKGSTLIPQWYAVYTRHCHEKKVFEQLQQMEIEAYLPMLTTIRQWKDWAIQGASKPCIQYVSDYVRGRLNQRVQEGIFMYKDPNILPLLMRHVIGLSYLQKPPMQPRPVDARSLALHV